MNEYRNALILGYGRSGQAADRLLRSEGCSTMVVAKEHTDDAALAELLKNQSFDVSIVSPGFSLDHPWVCAVRDAGVPLLSELELGWSRHRGKTVAVTGSNGKSTAVKWICECLCAAGLRAEIGGNYGVPACEVVLDHPDLEWLVLEVSSFQLETVNSFQPDIAVVLNVLPNHLDRHGTMESYWQTKACIFGQSPRSDAVCMVPHDWLERFRTAVGDGGTWVSFGASDAADYSFHEGRIMFKGSPVVDLSGTPFDNPVLGSCTGAAVTAVAAAVGFDFEVVERVARQFVALPHRMQVLGVIDDVKYINDSKGTNLSALAAAVQGCRSPVHLIAGGLAKETDFTFVKEILAERAKKIYLIGRASQSMYSAWNQICDCAECGTLEAAFQEARNLAKPGEIVLLSPGCASFDQFCSFEERGDQFADLFRRAGEAGKSTYGDSVGFGHSKKGV
ncbi:MAG: UDP-N-acetylmuramoyl-L-alanine--D-glutamate ligase [Pontiellaceae bacterium]|nr:UDP-N-acetylmuramoyl-L-alanine--D-glutamate ligase [Pontiellaceae bacterium]